MCIFGIDDMPHEYDQNFYGGGGEQGCCMGKGLKVKDA